MDIQNIYWQVMVMELSKLFKYNTSKPDKINSNDRFNLRLFINKFKPKGEFHHFKISNIKLKEWIHKLDHNEEIIKNILTQRNKLYAHEEETLIKNIVPLHQIKPLMLIVYDILKEIHHTIFERGIDFTPINSPVINLKVIVNNLAKYKKIKLNEYKSLADDYGLEDELK
ncbi:MAG: hypothetical protein IPQ11_16520 [Bacteroidetes bacterium]|nr:hypothetical protein [Bacteroidota bacterium]